MKMLGAFDEIWRKILDFGASIGLLPLILIVFDMKVSTPYFDHLMKWNPVMKVWKKWELMYEGKWDMKDEMLEGFGSWCQWDMKENVGLLGLLPLILIMQNLLWRFERNGSWCWWDMKENVRFWSKYRVVIMSHEMKPCYEGLKEMGVDVNEIWRKMLGFRVSIGLLPLILIVSWNETLLWRFERNGSWCQWDMNENVGF